MAKNTVLSVYGSERESVATVFFLKQDYFPYFTNYNIKFNILCDIIIFMPKILTNKPLISHFFLLDFSEW